MLPEGPETPLRRTRGPDIGSESSEDTVVEKNTDVISTGSHESMTSAELFRTKKVVVPRMSKAMRQYLRNRDVTPDSVIGRVLIRRYNNNSGR